MASMYWARSQITLEQAVSLHDTRFWESMNYEERAMFQLFEERLCMPFDVFREALERTLGRRVQNQEILFSDKLSVEILRGRATPSIDDILSLIPAHSRRLLAA